MSQVSGGVSLDALYKQYENLIGYAANCYRTISSAVDVDDLYQEGCLLLVHTWTRTDIPDEARVPMFKKSLFLLLRGKAYKQATLADRLNPFQYADDDQTSINLDAILAASDTALLSKIYADEFLEELRRMLDEDTVEVLDFLLDVEFEEEGEITRRGDWVPAVARRLGRTVNELYYQMWKLKEAAKVLAPRFGLEAA